MGNSRGMMAGLGQALSTVGTMGLNDQFERDKEARLEKIRLEAEARAEARGLAAEGRERGYKAEDRAAANADAVAAEGRAAEQAGKDRAAQHANRLEELRTASKLSKEEAAERVRLEREAAENQSYDRIEIAGTDERPGGVLFHDRKGTGKSRYFDAATMQFQDVGESGDVAKPVIPSDVLDEAARLALSEVERMDGFFASSADKARLKELGGRETAIATLKNVYTGTALRNYGYNPADFGYSEGEGLLTRAAKPPEQVPAGGRAIETSRNPVPPGNKAPASPSVTSPIPGVSVDAYNEAVRRLRANGKPTDPATVQKYLDHFKGKQNGGSQR